MADEFDPLDMIDALLAGVVNVPADVAKRFPTRPPGGNLLRAECERLAAGCVPRRLISALSDAACGKQPVPELRELLASFACKPRGEE